MLYDLPEVNRCPVAMGIWPYQCPLPLCIYGRDQLCPRQRSEAFVDYMNKDQRNFPQSSDGILVPTRTFSSELRVLVPQS